MPDSIDPARPAVPAGLIEALADRYRIERELGQGGMATVYLAQDLRHERKVALKVLRPDLAATLGPERFLQEVRIAANLQHPHILAVHDSGETGGFLYYVMPYIEGQSLRERLAKAGELPVAEAARILRDVADALVAAHAKGVVHRDIKPENIMLSGRHALVADFGVAKAVSEATGRQSLTTAGVALGTPTYMAPEQAAADPHLDHRADLYAFGVLAYETLTGQPPFTGLTPQGILAAHLTQAPTPVTERRDTIPQPLAQLIMRCLAKKPADRPQSAEELLGVLEAAATPSGGITPMDTRPMRAPAVAGRRGWLLGAVVVVVVAGALLANRFLQPRPLSITTSEIRQVTSEPGAEYQPALSPDGKQVAFVDFRSGRASFVIRSAINLTGGGEVRLADTSLGWQWLPRWSQDGEMVRFWACANDRCDWKEMGLLGGSVRALALPTTSSTVSWSPDGGRVAFGRGGDSLFAHDLANGKTTLLAVHKDRPWGLHSLAWSPDGRLVAYVNGNAVWRFGGNVAPSSIWVVNAAGGEPVRITSDSSLNVSPAWLDDRHLLFVSDRDGPRSLYLVEAGPDGPRGEPQSVPGASDVHSISYSIAARRLAFAKLTLRQNVWSYPLDRSTPLSIRDGRPETSGSQVIELHDISPDGRWLAYDNTLAGNQNLYRAPLGGGAPIELTAGKGNEHNPRVSPAGSEVAFQQTGRSGGEVWVVSAEGGTPVQLTHSPGSSSSPAWSPDGLRLAFTSNRADSTGRQYDVWLLSRDSLHGPWHDAVRVTDFGCGAPVWQPDENGVLCRSRDLSTLTLVSPTGEVLWRRNVTAVDGLTIDGRQAYSRDGKTVYFYGSHRDARSGFWAIPVAGGGARLLVAEDDRRLVFYPNGVSVGPDRLYLTVGEYESDIWVMNLRY